MRNTIQEDKCVPFADLRVFKPGTACDNCTIPLFRPVFWRLPRGSFMLKFLTSAALVFGAVAAHAADNTTQIITDALH